tara:strand:- start:93 stop:1151 length:1059 start_codon:yes stop_codon:yes gene_type:complete
MKKINIIYFLPEMKGASGGAKIIYNHSNIINSLNENCSSQIIHLKRNIIYKFEASLAKRLNFLNDKYEGLNARKMKVSKNYSPDKNWQTDIYKKRQSLNFNKEKDFIILPEIWAHFAQDLSLAEKKINYGIFVQGFYHMFSTNNFTKLKKSYAKAKIIISDSDYSIKCIKNMFPEFANKIIKVNFSVNEHKFKISKKSNLITYMPRKLPHHAYLLIFYLENLLPKSWKIVPLINISEKKLIDYLGKSKIFLSFSNLEGIGIPPIEAALAGNKVIGYTGGGGIEYWKLPIFKKIEPGEIDDFGQDLLKEIKNYKPNWIKESKKYRKQLSKQYSEKNQTKSLIKLIKIINKFYI